MKYFLDCEFAEGTQKTFFGKTKPTIDLISIGIVTENDEEYYAISKDFNIKEAWNRYDVKTDWDGGIGKQRKVNWLRENVLKPIFYNLWQEKPHLQNLHPIPNKFTYGNFKRLIKLYGKSNEVIAKEIKEFVYRTSQINNPHTIANWNEVKHLFPVEFYTYYGAYDWVVFCWLFGKMIDLPKGFPMFSRDLKVMLEDKPVVYLPHIMMNGETYIVGCDPYYSSWKEHRDYPKQEDEHNALADAKWNKRLYEFLLSH